MKRLLKQILFLSVTLSVIFVSACNDTGCTDNQSSLPLAGFYSSQTKSAISIDSLTVFGVGMIGDTTIVNNANSMCQVYMPFNPGATQAQFVLRYEQKAFSNFGIEDTLTVSYEAVPFFHSNECGAMYVYDIKDYSTTHALIDSVLFLAPRIDNTNKENIQIFFRTKEADNE